MRGMRLLCAISHHGLGHLAQAAPVLNAMAQARPDLQWTIWSGLSRTDLAGRLDMHFAHRREAADVGLLMHDAVRVDEPASRLAYLDFHRDWPTRVAAEAAWLRQQDIDGVLSNVAYLPLAAATSAGIAGLGFCSLNWWDIAHPYLRDTPDMALPLRQMRTAYQSTRAFLRLDPGLPMAWMPRLEGMPPVAALGRNLRAQIDARLNLVAGLKLVLLGFGGVAYRSPAPLPHIEGVAWLVPDDWPIAGRDDLIGFARIGLPFLEMLASSDALVTKVGYGSFVEAAGLGLPVLYLDRPDWPETPWLGTWLAQHTRAHAISETTLFSPAVATELARLCHIPAPPPPDVSAAPVIARRILDCLGS